MQGTFCIVCFFSLLYCLQDVWEFVDADGDIDVVVVVVIFANFSYLFSLGFCSEIVHLSIKNNQIASLPSNIFSLIREV